MIPLQLRLGEEKSCNRKTHSVSVPGQKPRPWREGILQRANLKPNPSEGKNRPPFQPSCLPWETGKREGEWNIENYTTGGGTEVTG